MVVRRKHWMARVILAAVAVAVIAMPARAQIGPVLLGPGPVNRSMGGTAVAAPLDGLGAFYWNPGTLTAIPNSLDFGLEVLIPHTTLGSAVAPGALAPGFPPIALAGDTGSKAGVYPLPSIALTYTSCDSSITWGLGVFPVAGFGVNYPASGVNPALGPVNPVLTAQPPNGFGVGALYSNFQVLQLAPTVAVKLSDRLSVGGGPTLDMASLNVDPLLVASLNPDGSYPPGTHGRVTWGAGFQLGVYYILDGGWRVGASFKSQQWLENFHWQSVDPMGRPRPTAFQADLPMIPSIGIAYAGINRLLLAADFRYVDFHNTPGVAQGGYDATGAARGLGWKSVFALALGGQYQVTDALSVRAGYTYNDNQIPGSQVTFNIASPVILEHTASIGATYRVTDCLSLSLAYAHGFENSISGPLVTPLGAVPGTVVRTKAVLDTVLFGASVRFGPRVN